MPPPTSKAWNYFKRTADSKTVKCKLCETELKHTGGTTNMLNHLRLKHNFNCVRHAAFINGFH